MSGFNLMLNKNVYGLQTAGGTQFTCFSGTKVQILTLEDEEVLDEWMREVLSLLALLVYKYKY